MSIHSFRPGSRRYFTRSSKSRGADRVIRWFLSCLIMVATLGEDIAGLPGDGTRDDTKTGKALDFINMACAVCLLTTGPRVM